MSDPSSKESWMSAAESSLRLMLSHSTVSRITTIMTSRPRRSLQAFPNPALIALTELRRILTDLRGSLADIRRILSNQQARLQDVTQHLASLKASTALSSDNNWRTRIDCGKRFCQAQIDGDKEAAEYWRKLGDETYAGERGRCRHLRGSGRFVINTGSWQRSSWTCLPIFYQAGKSDSTPRVAR